MTPAERVKRIDDETRGVQSLYGVTSWEREFLASIQRRDTLTEKQKETLAEIERKVFGAGTDTDTHTDDLFGRRGNAR